MSARSQELPSLTPEKRLEAYQLITNGCQHLWGRTKLGEKADGSPIWAAGRFKADKIDTVLAQLVPLTKTDPYFLAHYTSYVLKNDLTKDLKTLLTYVALLSDADGTPFSVGSKYKKPNLRFVGVAALCKLDPILVNRVAQLARRKFHVDNYLTDARHFPMILLTAIHRYIKFREMNPQSLNGLVKAGMRQQFIELCRRSHYNLSDEAREIVRWPRRGVKLEKKAPMFEGLDDLAIAQKVADEKLTFFSLMGELTRVNKKMSPVIAVALLQQCTPDQAVILRSVFEDAGLLEDSEVFALYQEKISGAKNALDRIESIAKEASAAVKKAMKTARSEVNKAKMAGLGKIFVNLDFSGSMSSVRDVAADRGTIIAELVNNPAENFAWGWFSDRAHRLPLPQAFERDAFAQALYGQGDGGGTDCLALYREAREFGANIDVYLTDQDHTYGDMTSRIKRFHEDHPEFTKPSACLVVHFTGSGWRSQHMVKDAYEANEIPVVEITPDSLSSTVQLADSIKVAMKGPLSTIDDIMDTPLLKLPDYYFSI